MRHSGGNRGNFPTRSRNLNYAPPEIFSFGEVQPRSILHNRAMLADTVISELSYSDDLRNREGHVPPEEHSGKNCNHKTRSGGPSPSTSVRGQACGSGNLL